MEVKIRSKNLERGCMDLKNTILIVDDEASICKLLQNAFSKKGYTVKTAESAEIALGILKKETIQVMFIDLYLPSMNGIELCKEIRKSNRSAAIFVITGFPSLLEEVKSNGAGFDGWFSKPLDLEDLFKAAEDGFRKSAD